jgi:hypothetical protein
MLIPNKFNGYRKDGTRNLYIGGGVGEAALLEAMMTGAAVGGGSSIIQGKDPLQGALLGGLMGGAGGAMFGGAGAGAGEAASGAMPGAEAAFSAQTPTGLNVIPGEAGTQALQTQAATPFTAQTATGLSTLPGEAGIGGIEPAQGMFGKANQWFSGLTPKQQLLAGGAGIAGLGMVSDQLRGGIPKKKEYKGALSRFSYNPDTYIPYRFAGGGNTGGIASLGGYSDGGRMLKGPGDGMSDSIPASIGSKQPARLADGEFVVPADVVSHLGNGSTDAGAKQLYSMMNKVRNARTGNPKQGRQIQPRKYLPA